MKEFLDKFSLSLILRQFFCGVVFFVPLFCISGTTQNTKVHSLNEWIQGGFFNHDWSTPKVSALCVLACIVGTIIYHLEKNLWSYPLQCLFERTFNETVHTRDKDKEIEHNGALPAASLLGSFFAFFILFAIILSSFKSIPDWVGKFSPLLACGIFLIYILLIWICLLQEVLKGHQYYADCFQNVMQRTRAMWVMEELNGKELQQFASLHDGKTFFVHNPSYRDALACAAIAKRLASWSDYIHSVQCMCFAWIVGVMCASSIDTNLANSQNMWCSVWLAVAVILLESAFEYHRYRHLVYITAHFYRIHSSLDSLYQHK